MLFRSPPITGDNCGVFSTINNYNGTSDASDIYPVGTTAVTWTVTDVNGNTNTCVQNITIITIPPSFTTCPGPIVQASDPGVCNAVVAYATVVAGDPVLVETYDFTGATVANGAGNGSGSTFNVGVTNVTVTCSNGVPPDATCVFTVTVNDTENPTIIPPPNIIVNNDPGSCFAVIFIGNPVAADNCGVFSITNDGLGAYPVGTTTVTWTAQDFAGNSSSTTQTVQVNDNEVPNTICQNISVNLDAFGNVTIVPAQVDNGSTDNCGIAVMSLSQTNFNCGDVGPNNVTLTVTDINGNFSSCIAVVTIVDNTSP